MDYSTQVLRDLVPQQIEANSFDGQRYVLRVRPYRTVTNVIDGVVITFEDITVHKQVEMRLQENRASMALAQRIAKLGSWTLDLKNSETTWSDQLFDIFGIPPDHGPLGEADILKHIHPEDRESYVGTTRELDSTRTAEFEYRVVRPDGQTRWVSGLAETICSESGTPLTRVGTIQDITERKRVEQAKNDIEQQYRTLLDIFPEAIMLVDAKTMAMVDFNQQAAEALGYTREELEALTLTDIEDAAPRDAETSKPLIPSRKKTSFANRYRTKDGHVRHIEGTAKFVTIAGRQLILTTWHSTEPASS